MSGNGSPGGLLTDEVAEARRITAARFAELRANMGSESGDKGGGGNKEIAEALLLAAMGSKEVVAKAALHGALRKRRVQSRGEAFFPEEHVGYSPNVAMASLGLARQADARGVAQALSVDVRQVREVQRNLRIQDMDAVLRADYHTGVIEQAARANLWQQGRGGPDTPPEQVWRLALDDNVDLGRWDPRDLAQGWLSAANSHEPGAREAREKFYEAIGDNHAQAGEAIDRQIGKDVNFVGDPHSSRIDANSVMSAASPQVNGRPMQTMEEAWNKAIPAFKDPRSDPNKLRDTAESLITAAHDGKVPGAALLNMIDNAKRTFPGFTENYKKGLNTAEARVAKGDPNKFPQGDAILYALDKNRGFPVPVPRDRAQDTRAVNTGGATLRAQDPAAAVAADPRLLLGEGAGLHKSAGQLKLGHERLNPSARPEVGLAEATSRGTGAANGSENLRYANGARVRARHGDGQGVRLGGNERRAEVREGNRNSRVSRRTYHSGDVARGVHGDTRLPRDSVRMRKAVTRALHQSNSRLHKKATTTTTRRGAAR
jgi:hypothetical protein